MSEFNTSELNQNKFNTQTLKEEDKEKDEEEQEEKTKYHNDNFLKRTKKLASQFDLSLDIMTKVDWIQKSAFLTKQDLDDFHYNRVSINYLYQKHKILEQRFVVDQLRKNKTHEQIFEEAARLFEENHK